MSLRTCTLLLSLMALAGPAWAQEAIVEGPGYQVTEGTVIHPSLGIGTGLIYNPYYESSDATATPVLRLRGAFAMANQGNRPRGELRLLQDDSEPGASSAPGLDFRLGGVVDYQWWTSAAGPGTRHQISGGLDLHLMTAPQGVTSFFIDNNLMRVTDPPNFESYGRNLNRVINRLKTGLQVRPGGGAFRFAGQYENTVDYFESGASDFANRIHHLVRGRAEWQFLPITRFYLDASLGYFVAAGGACELVKNESRPLRVELGSSTAFTERTSLRVHLGAGRGFYRERAECSGGVRVPATDFTSPLFRNWVGLLAGAELSYRYSPLGRVSVTYEHDFEDSVQANFYRDHALGGRIIHQLDRVLVHTGADIRLRGYRGVPPGLTGGSSMDYDSAILRLFGKGYYPYRDWLGFVGDVSLESDSSAGYTRLGLQLSAVAAF
ncbi:MAG: hypothetical protein Tsb0020_49890 [Haliangiales bacterium]